jgi:hypothetical protein
MSMWSPLLSQTCPCGLSFVVFFFFIWGSSWSWSFGIWIYNYLCNQCPSPLTLWVRIPSRRGVLEKTLCDKVCQWLAAGQWFFPGTLVFFTNKSDCPNITAILLKTVLPTISIHTLQQQRHVLSAKLDELKDRCRWIEEEKTIKWVTVVWH